MTDSTPKPDRNPHALARRLTPMSELLAEAERPTDWTVTGILPASELLLLYGPQHSGKTYAALDLALAVATGTPWHGYHVTEARPVLYVPSEGRRGIGRRIAAAFAYHHPGRSPDSVPLYLWPYDLDVTTDAGVVPLGQTIRAEGVGLVIVDVLSDFAAGVEENSRDFGHALGRLRKVGQLTGAAVVAVHHAGKDISRGARGHSSIAGTADLIVRCSGNPLPGPDGDIYATSVLLDGTPPHGKNRNEDPWRMTLDLRKPTGAPAPVVVGLWTGETGGPASTTTPEVEVLDILRGHPDGLTSAEVGDLLGGLSRQAADKRLAPLLDPARRLVERTDSRPYRYRLATAPRVQPALVALDPDATGPERNQEGLHSVALDTDTPENPIPDKGENAQPPAGCTRLQTVANTPTRTQPTPNPLGGALVAKGGQGLEHDPERVPWWALNDPEAVEAQEAGMTIDQWRHYGGGQDPDAEDITHAWAVVIEDALNNPEGRR